MESNWSDRVILNNVIPLNKETGRGAYGRVFAAKYCRLVCAAKEIPSILLEVQDEETESVIQSFLLECWHCSRSSAIPTSYSSWMCTTMSPPVKPTNYGNGANGPQFDLFGRERENVEINTKVSILHDVCLGLSYLHSHNEPIVHRDLIISK